jgi:hypothetical protein
VLAVDKSNVLIWFFLQIYKQMARFISLGRFCEWVAQYPPPTSLVPDMQPVPFVFMAFGICVTPLTILALSTSNGKSNQLLDLNNGTVFFTTHEIRLVTDARASIWS